MLDSSTPTTSQTGEPTTKSTNIPSETRLAEGPLAPFTWQLISTATNMCVTAETWTSVATAYSRELTSLSRQ